MLRSPNGSGCGIHTERQKKLESELVLHCIGSRTNQGAQVSSGSAARSSLAQWDDRLWSFLQHVTRKLIMSLCHAGFSASDLAARYGHKHRIFAFCAPLIGVFPPEEYLQCMGRQLNPSQDSDQDMMPQITRLFTPSLDTFPEKFTTTTLSADGRYPRCSSSSRSCAKHGSRCGLRRRGPKLPLDSWMAYREFYNGLLASYTRKSISKCLTIVWHADLFACRWSILVKAYSIVRGCREKKDAPLDGFFAFCADEVVAQSRNVL
ncbi:hypothetical protein AC579_1856 [Pseudocercospora musae]|uniref:Mating-type protein MAT-1 n=1 Tax=Pseudocercospora musae TaxID=113226 RepID=A0A139IBG1_9PEZI|nr:hypothetical protein AC579_1856 [Pseudocercospora musae]